MSPRTGAKLPAEPLHVTVGDMGGGTSALQYRKGSIAQQGRGTMGNHVAHDRSGQGRKADTTRWMKRAARVTPQST